MRISYWDAEKARHNPARLGIGALDALAFPNHDCFDTEPYFRLMRRSDFLAALSPYSQPRIMPLLMGRGCPFNCTFCCHQGVSPYRQRNIETGLAEIDLCY